MERKLCEQGFGWPFKAAMPVGQDDVKKLEEQQKELHAEVKSLKLVGVNKGLLTAKKKRKQTFA